ncbi:MAG: polysaccharide biosynthesis transport protein [Blastocatellia bacterium]|nr:polysaccharide biosynthesis transport protein [Blastocatellia bacterium]
MSKNFELMQDARIMVGSTEAAETQPRPVTVNDKAHEAVSGTHLNWQDEITREETLKLVQSIFLSRSERSSRAVVFASVDSGNGCSRICAQVAEALAGQKRGRVCLVDANLRSPVLPDLFTVSNHYGLTDAISNRGSIRDFVKLIGSSNNLWLLSSGSLASNSPGLFNSETMKARVSELREQFEYVLIDSPPLNNYADGVAIGQLADGVVVILEANGTRREAAIKITENLRAAPIPILGAVLNKRTFPIPTSLYNML